MDTNEKSKLLKNNSMKHENWSWKSLNKYYKPLLLCTFLIIVVCALYVCINISLAPLEYNGDNTIDKTNALHISSVATTNNDYIRKCAPQITCDPYAKYRSINGSCNNLKMPTWGASRTPFLRILDANYSDGFNKLRTQSNGTDLPLPRELNVKLFLGREKYQVDENNVLLMPFLQLIAHDVTGVTEDIPSPPNAHSSTLIVESCCTDEVLMKTLPQCATAVIIPPDDPVYSKIGVKCQDVYRFKTSANYSCPLKTRTIMNEKTSFIDASEVYGSNDTVALRLRTMKEGKLNYTTNAHGQMFCPYLPYKREFASIQYDAGDPDSINQNMGITTISTLFLRFHNYIASRLLTINPSWSDEILYQEARKIIVGTLQRITYEDLLPIMIGSDYQELYGINKENTYDPTVNPSTSLEFSTAAYRALHTIIPVQFEFMNNNYEIESSMNITDWMSDPELLPLGNNFDELFKGFLETPGRIPQHSYNFFVSNFLFYNPNKTSASTKPFDLLSIDILAGRDAGIQPYNQLRHLCGLPLANDFEDLVDSIHVKDIAKLKEIYQSVNDIDLLVGMLLEKLSDGALVGPTAQCLIADCFYRFKVGDRFFYDVQGQPGSFKPEQLKVIKTITLGHVICASSNVDHVQKDIFKMVDHNIFPTSKLKCDEQFDIDLSAWHQYGDQQEL